LIKEQPEVRSAGFSRAGRAEGCATPLLHQAKNGLRGGFHSRSERAAALAAMILPGGLFTSTEIVTGISFGGCCGLAAMIQCPPEVGGK